MNILSFHSGKINPYIPLGTTHGTMANARLHREEMVDVANEIVDKKLEQLLPQLYQEAYHDAYQRFVENLSFDVETCVNVMLENGDSIFKDSKTRKVIANRIMEEIKKQMRDKWTVEL